MIIPAKIAKVVIIVTPIKPPELSAARRPWPARRRPPSVAYYKHSTRAPLVKRYFLQNSQYSECSDYSAAARQPLATPLASRSPRARQPLATGPPAARHGPASRSPRARQPLATGPPAARHGPASRSPRARQPLASLCQHNPHDHCNRNNQHNRQHPYLIPHNPHDRPFPYNRHRTHQPV
jgi:hypothetical protein